MQRRNSLDVVPYAGKCTDVHSLSSKGKKGILFLMFGMLSVVSRHGAFGKIEATSGPALVGIILPEKATATEKRAASELQHYLAIMTGDTLPVTAESERKQLVGRVISVGRTQIAHSVLPPSGWKEETILIDTRSRENIVITGGSDTAVLFAAYRFLHGLGCRWLKPDVDGEYVPSRKRIEVPRRRLISTPDFRVRGWIAAPSYSLVDMGDKGPFAMDQETLRDWGVRNGLNSLTVNSIVDLGEDRGHGYQQRMGHTLIVLIPSGDHPDTAKLFAEHPEYYPLVDGVRVTKYKDGRPVQACLSNPNIVKFAAQKVIAYLKEHPNTRRFNVAHNDEPTYWCECPNCRAWDGPGSTWEKNSLYDAYPDRSPAGPGPMSARWVHFVNEVANIVGRQFPNVYISFYAYASTVAPPRSPGWKLEKNVMVEYANDGICFHHAITDRSCKANEAFYYWLTGWASRGQPVIIYDYEPYPGRWRQLDLPVLWYSGLVDYMRSAKKLGVYGWAGEHIQIWTGSTLWLYLKANLLWDTRSDVEYLMTDFCDHYYGAAGPTMKQCYHLLDSLTTGQTGHIGLDDRLDTIDTSKLNHAMQLLNKATSQCAGDDRAVDHVSEAKTSIVALRIAILQKGSQKNPKAFQQYNTALTQLGVLLRGGKVPIPISYGLYQQLASAYKPPFEAIAGRLAAELPLEWRFRTDPKDEGEKLGWPASRGNESEWRPIRTDDSWTNQSYLGSYHGVGWYVTSFDVPKTITGRLWLLFGAIDGDAWFWINGKPAGKTVAPPAVAWDKPFGLDITESVTQGQNNWLVVKVRKEAFGAGIWKPVKLMETPGKG